jgi:hypothetical protein
MIKFDSDLLELCDCGRPTLLVEFFANGDWVIGCHCGHYWPTSLVP